MLKNSAARAREIKLKQIIVGGVRVSVLFPVVRAALVKH